MAGEGAARYEELRRLFLEVHDLDAAGRETRLSELARVDPGMAAELRALLGGARDETQFLARPVDAHRLLALQLEDGLLPLRDRVGPYRIERLLGEGMSGNVYFAVEEGSERRVALKLLRRDSVDSAALERFQQEVRLLAELRHPGIVPVYRAGVEHTAAGAEPWFAMAYVDGRNLLEHVRTVRPELRERVRLALDLCEAVQAAHEQGIVHRDLKPENVLVDARGHVHVLDFGLARARGLNGSGATRTGDVLGTLAYMAPEQADGRAHRVDARADVYALGTLLYELLAERLPLAVRGVPIHEAVHAILEQEPLPLVGRDGLDGLDSELETVVRQALQKEPERRYPDAGALAADLKRWLAGEAVEARAPGTLERLRRVARRNRGLVRVTAGVFASLCLGLLLAGFALRRTRAAERFATRERAAEQRLSDMRAIEQLQATSEELWPADGQHLEALERWVAEARTLLTRPTQAERAATVGERALAADLRRELARLGAPDGPLGEMERRADFARTLARRSIDEPAADWETARTSIARSPLYHALALEPQEGLIPLGPDPGSGLWEFALLDPWNEPVRPAAGTGQIRLGERSGLVFVLLPGATYLQGAQACDERAPNFDPRARVQDGPPREVALEPFFLSKFELTQGQWSRVMGTQPSRYHEGVALHEYQDLRCPVLFVSWDEATHCAARMGLELPTEAQWEYAARGGTSTAFWCGDWPLCLFGSEVVNIDNVFAELGLARRLNELFSRARPVGTGRANPFGLYDVLGNVAEWCRDDFFVDYFRRELRAGDGLALGQSDDHRAVRGGNAFDGSKEARIALHNDAPRGFRSLFIGLRPVRALQRSTGP